MIFFQQYDLAAMQLRKTPYETPQHAFNWLISNCINCVIPKTLYDLDLINS